MSDYDDDPAASTQMFQAFKDREVEPEPTGARWWWFAVAVGGLVAVAAVAWFLIG